MNEPLVPLPSPEQIPAAATIAGEARSAAPPTSEPPVDAARARAHPDRDRWMGAALVLLGVFSVLAAGLSWETRERVRVLEQELVKRQEASHEQVTEARALSKQAQDAARDSVARVAVLEAKLAESTLQRGQLEDLIQSLSRSRDENVLADTEAAIRVAAQQSAITGSAEPLVAALRQADERLARVNEPRLEGVRRAVARDLDRVRAAGVVDISSVTIRLDDVVRMVDELPLLANAQPQGADERPAPEAAMAAAAPASVPDTGAFEWPAWMRSLGQAWRDGVAHVWRETKSLVRVTHIADPEAALIAPEQAYFLRENLKLRLLNARLALLSRQFDLAQADLRIAQGALERYFDRGSRRVAAGIDQLRQIAAQVRVVNMPKPDETLAALATASGGR